jgi:hypothetical protein
LLQDGRSRIPAFAHVADQVERAGHQHDIVGASQLQRFRDRAQGVWLGVRQEAIRRVRGDVGGANGRLGQHVRRGGDQCLDVRQQLGQHLAMTLGFQHAEDQHHTPAWEERLQFAHQRADFLRIVGAIQHDQWRALDQLHPSRKTRRRQAGCNRVVGH